MRKLHLHNVDKEYCNDDSLLSSQQRQLIYVREREKRQDAVKNSRRNTSCIEQHPAIYVAFIICRTQAVFDAESIPKCRDWATLSQRARYLE